MANILGLFQCLVYSNTSLTCVQKFNYLRAKLQGDAARVVIGLALTDVNYEQSVALLREIWSAIQTN